MPHLPPSVAAATHGAAGNPLLASLPLGETHPAATGAAVRASGVGCVEEVRALPRRIALGRAVPSPEGRRLG